MTPWSFPKTALLLVIGAGLVQACLPAWGQVDTITTSDAETDTVDEGQLLIPPPVSNQSYPTEFVDEAEQNYFRVGFVFSSGYSSNVSNTSKPVGDVSYSFWPTIAVNRATSQLHLLASYSPGFTIYQKTSSYNQANQNLTLNLDDLLSPRLSMSVHEEFQQTSNVFNQPTPLTIVPVSGSPAVTSLGIVPPLADQIYNRTSAQFAYQLDATSIIGATGTFEHIQYLNSELYNLQAAGGTAFYSHRLGEKYYIGGSYQYVTTQSYQTGAPTTPAQLQSVLAFFSIFFRPTLSVSISGGPQHFMGTQPLSPTISSWTPLLAISCAWQGQRTTLAASYSRAVSGSGGLSGVFHSTTVSASADWKVSRNWVAAVRASYANNAPLFVASSGERTILGTVLGQRHLSERANLELGYSWVNQNYRQIVPVTSIPNINRVFFSLNYQLIKPLQR
jgi:hypothetical protein